MTVNFGQKTIPETSNQKTVKSGNQANPSFRGASDVCVKVMDEIGKHGLAGSYIAQDGIGMVIPRVGAGFLRNRNKTGESNKAFALMEAVREVVSGPSMFVIPWMILSTSKKFIGRALEVPVAELSAFGNSFEKFIENKSVSESKPLKQGFYKDIYSKVFKDTGLTNVPEEKLNEFVQKTDKIGDLNARRVFAPRADKKESEKLFSELYDSFVELGKNHGRDCAELDKALIDNAGNKMRIGSFKDFVAHLVDYTEDVTSKITVKSKSEGFKAGDFVKKFNAGSKVYRYALNLLMTGAVIAFSTQVPKLYKAFSKTNPGTIGLLPEEEQKEPSKSGKEVV